MKTPLLTAVSIHTELLLSSHVALIQPLNFKGYSKGFPMDFKGFPRGCRTNICLDYSRIIANNHATYQMSLVP